MLSYSWCNGVWPEPLNWSVLSCFLLCFWRFRTAGVQHWLKNSSSSIDKPKMTKNESYEDIRKIRLSIPKPSAKQDHTHTWLIQREFDSAAFGCGREFPAGSFLAYWNSVLSRIACLHTTLVNVKGGWFCLVQVLLVSPVLSKERSGETITLPALCSDLPKAQNMSLIKWYQNANPAQGILTAGQDNTPVNHVAYSLVKDDSSKDLAHDHLCPTSIPSSFSFT